jgi:uncharacterized membrane protein SpoIIM required for sporulation
VRSTLPRMRLSIAFMTGALVAAYVIGQGLASDYRLPARLLTYGRAEAGVLEQLQRFGMLTGTGWLIVLGSNLRAIALATLLGGFSFGVAGVVLLMAPVGIIGYFAGNVGLAGQDVIRFLLALVAPHAVLEIPAAILAGAAILQLGLAVVSPPKGKTLGQNWLFSLAEWGRISFGLVLPLLAGAAALEVFVTPRLALHLLTGS